jgi:glycosyltransferase involved in cell wall biosynthesis
MTNVTFFIGTVKLGGTEAKLVRNFLPALKKGEVLNPKLLLLRNEGEFANLIPDDIETFSLEEEKRTKLPQLVVRLRKALNKLDSEVLVSCMWYPALISYGARRLSPGAFTHVIHDTVPMMEFIKYELSHERFRWLKLHLIRKAYADADALIGNSQGVKDDFLDFGMQAEKVHMIYNPLNREMIVRMAEEESDINVNVPLVVSAGRLVYQKAFDVLMKAFRKVRDQVKAKLLIIGDGYMKQELLSMREALGLRDDVVFTGFQQNPFKFIKHATVFCLASRYEGFPNVVLEAMTLGVPVVVTNCHAGPSEITEDGKYGILIPPEDPDALAEAILTILTDSQLRDKFSALALAKSGDFGFEASLAAYEHLLSNGKTS